MKRGRIIIFLWTAVLCFSHTVTLNWTQSATAGVTSNNVYRGTTSGGPYTQIYSSSSPITSYVDTAPVLPGYYVVTAVDSNGESSYSNEILAQVSTALVISGNVSLRGNVSLNASGGGLSFLPSLPQTWVDGEELLCTIGSSCSSGSPGLSLTAPTYTLTLTSGGGSWSPSAPCSLGTTRYTNNGAGLTNAITDTEACRITNGVGTIIILPVTSTDSGTGCDTGAYCSSSGFLIPQSATTNATTPIIIRSASDATLAALPEPVCAGGIQDNVAAATSPGLINADCKGDALAYQLGTTVTSVTCSSFTFANGTPCASYNAASYNYLQYMPQLECSGLNCTPLSFCSPSTTTCLHNSLGPDHWEFEDIAVSLPAGSSSNSFLITVGNVQSATFVSPSNTQFAEHIHFRRVWAHGDWTSLSTGTNSVAGGILLGACYYCSVEGSQVSQALRPGGEGHQMGIDGTALKLNNLWLEGQSSGSFAGGFVTPPATPTYQPATDVEIGRVRYTFPYAWLGENCTYTSGNGNAGGHACGNVPNSNAYWGGAGDNTGTYSSGGADAGSSPLPACPGLTNETCVSTSGTTVTWISGPKFHDSNSAWNVGSKQVFINNSTSSSAPGCVNGSTPVACKVVAIGTGSCPSSCPTTLTLNYPTATTPGGSTAGNLTNVPFVLNGQSIVRKNVTEVKEANRILWYGIIGENVDNSGAQNGVNFEADIRSTSGGGQGQNYGASINDVTFIDSILRHTCTGFELDARSAPSGGNGGGVSQAERRMTLANILHYDNSANNPGCNLSNFGSLINTANETWTGTLSCTSGICTFVANYSVDARANLESDALASVSISGTSGTITTSGSNTFQSGEFVSFIGTGTCLDGNPGTVGTTGTTFTISSLNSCAASGSVSGYAQGPAGFQTFGMNTGDPVYITGCTQSADNMPSAAGYTNIAQQTGAAYAPYATGGLTPWNATTGWVPGNTTVTYPWAGGVNDSSGTCTLINSTGNPQYLTLNHHTMVVDAQNPIGSGPSKSHGATVQLYNTVANSLFFSGPFATYGQGNGGFYNSSVNAPHEGTVIETFAYDLTTSTLCGLVFPTRINNGTSPYSQWSANSNFSCSTAFAFPATTCAVGFNGSAADSPAWNYGNCTANSGNAVPTLTADYHAYILNTASTFHAAASDGLDIGAIISGTAFNGSSIDDAQTRTKFVCSMAGTTCTGSPFQY